MLACCTNGSPPEYDGAKGAKVLVNKYGTQKDAYVAMSAEEITPAWLSALCGRMVKSFDTKVCTEGQVGITVLMTKILYEVDQPDMPTSLACKMHGPGEEQRQGAGAMGLYSKEILMYHKHMTAIPITTPKAVAILHLGSEEYLTMVHFNLLMDDLNVMWEPYKAGEVHGVPNQKEWDAIFANVVKMHLQYWEDKGMRKKPFVTDDTGLFDLTPIEHMMANNSCSLAVPWETAIRKFSGPYFPAGGEFNFEEMIKPFFDCYKAWQGDDGPKIMKIVIGRLRTAPHTLCHGDVNPGNIWKGKKGTASEGDFCFGDWQITRMGPAAWDFCTPMIGIEPGDPCNATVGQSLKTYYGKLTELKPEILKTYPYDEFEMHVKCAAICFFMFAMGYVYTSMVKPSEEGIMDKGKMEFTWSNFAPHCVRRMSMACKELNMLSFTKELLASGEDQKPAGFALPAAKGA